MTGCIGVSQNTRLLIIPSETQVTPVGQMYIYQSNNKTNVMEFYRGSVVAHTVLKTSDVTVLSHCTSCKGKWSQGGAKQLSFFSSLVCGWI